MRWSLLVAALASGCAFDPTGAGTPDAGDGPAPIDAAPDVPDVPDRDNDGVLDAVDNCPDQPNAQQHDEDGDGDGDVCDLCPHLAGAQADVDGDGVGDGCDPSTSARHTIVLFEGFGDNRRGWPVGGGRWSVDGDDMVLTAGAAAIIMLPAGTGAFGADHFVETAVELTSVGDGFAGIHFAATTPTGTDGHTCAARRIAGTDEAVLRRQSLGVERRASFTNRFVDGDVVELQGDSVGNTVTCLAEHRNQRVAPSYTDVPVGASIGLRGSLSARFRYLIVYRLVR